MKTIKDLLIELFDTGTLKPDGQVSVAHSGINFIIKPKVVCGVLRVVVIAKPPAEPTNTRAFNAHSPVDILLTHVVNLANNLGEPGFKVTKADVSKSLISE